MLRLNGLPAVNDKIQRSRNLTLLRNVGLFAFAVYLLKNNSEYFAPPPTEELTRFLEQQQAQLAALQQQAMANMKE